MVWTVDDFIENVGRSPESDDLERCNCPDAGKFGHKGCGICKHKKPFFECHECFVSRFDRYQLENVS